MNEDYLLLVRVRPGSNLRHDLAQLVKRLGRDHGIEVRFVRPARDADYPSPAWRGREPAAVVAEATPDGPAPDEEP